jgi:hypothetical protein
LHSSQLVQISLTCSPPDRPVPSMPTFESADDETSLGFELDMSSTVR